jgi:hypothetical protein
MIVLDGSEGITQEGKFNSNSTFGFRNRIINGDMRINQRARGTYTPTTAGSPANYSIDRWTFALNQSSKLTTAQSTEAPSGFTNSLLVTSSSAYSPSGTDYFYLLSRLEGTNVADLGFGTANAKTITVSFWVRSSLTGTFGANLSNSANNRAYPFTYSISAADTWEYKTTTIAGDTSGTWLTTTGTGLELSFSMGMGSTYGSGTAGAWAGSWGFPSGAVSVVGTNGATWYITGVQLEAGSVATPFERRPFGTELQLCYRYYFKSALVETGNDYAVSFNPSTTTARGTIPFPVSMRTGPSALEQSGTATDYSVRHGTSVTNCSSVPIYAGGTAFNAGVIFTVASGLTAGQGSQLRNNNGTAGYLAWSAEL